MSAGELKIDARRKRILELLERDGKVVVSQLSAMLGTTTVTIRNDLDALERSGYLERIQGGAILKITPAHPESSVRCLAEKRRMAETLAEIICDGDTLFLNGGTTTLALAQALKQRQRLNVVTNSAAIAAELSGLPTLRVILLGGEFNPHYGFTYGGDAQEQLRKYQADYAILSVDGISAAGGITTYHAEEAILDRMMAAQSRKTIILADHTKLGRAGFSLIFGADQAQTLVTDGPCNPEQLAQLQEAGLTVMQA